MRYRFIRVESNITFLVTWPVKRGFKKPLKQVKLGTGVRVGIHNDGCVSILHERNKLQCSLVITRSKD